MRTLSFLFIVAACHGTTSPSNPGDDSPDAGSTPTVDGATGCAPGLAGAGCILALYDRTVLDCSLLGELRGELDARTNLGPLWSGGRALFGTSLAVG